MKKDILTSLSTRAPEKINKEKTKIKTAEIIQEIGTLQKILYAQSRYSFLIVLQGLDASGKDGVISKVFSNINPLGCDVVAFKAPTEIERKHDFLWRIHSHVPEKGIIQIFNRSHYEDVLVPRVEKWVSSDVIKKRFQFINQFEELICQENNTVIIKFYLHISRQEQLERLTERKTNPQKFWKHNDGDWETNKKWDLYMEAYEDIFKHCNNIPWTIVPSDQNWYKEYLIASTILKELKKLDLEYPKLAK